MAYSIEAVEHDIQSIYREAARVSPSIRLREEGRLADLWRWADNYYHENKEN